MALDAEEVRSFGNVTIYVGDVGATEPADLTTTPDESEWFEVGHTSDEGVSFSFGKARTPFRSHQSYPQPVRVVKGEAVTTVGVSLLQWNAANLAYALGGGEWTEDNSGEFTFTPANASVDNEKALIIDAFDGDITSRWIFRRTEVQSNVDFTASPTALAPLPISAVVLAAPGEADDYNFITDDPAFELVGS
jgi:hypothetical protein